MIVSVQDKKNFPFLILLCIQRKKTQLQSIVAHTHTFSILPFGPLFFFILCLVPSSNRRPTFKLPSAPDDSCFQHTRMHLTSFDLQITCPSCSCNGQGSSPFALCRMILTTAYRRLSSFLSMFTQRVVQRIPLSCELFFKTFLWQVFGRLSWSSVASRSAPAQGHLEEEGFRLCACKSLLPVSHFFCCLSSLVVESTTGWIIPFFFCFHRPWRLLSSPEVAD